MTGAQIIWEDYMKVFSAITAVALLAAAPAVAQTSLSVATGGTGGVYYPMGGGLAEVINGKVEGYSATAEVTGASVENMGLVATGDADLAIGLADTVYQAQTGTGRFEGQQLDMIRGIASMYANMIQIVTLADSGITSLEEIQRLLAQGCDKVSINTVAVKRPALIAQAETLPCRWHGVRVVLSQKVLQVMLLFIIINRVADFTRIGFPREGRKAAIGAVITGHLF